MKTITEHIDTDLGCLHCHEPVSEGDAFCCNGCEWVYKILNQNGLSDYYKIRESLGSIQKPRPVSFSSTDFSYLDDLDQIQPQWSNDKHKLLNFYLDGVHCAACVWLVEKLPEFVPGVVDAELNLSSHTARITLDATAKFAEAAETLQSWGYRPHVVNSDQEIETHQRKTQVSMLMRIGVAAFSAGNLMILSVALYSGLEGYLARYFEYLSLFLALPALTYSAWPFYRQAWSQIFYSRQISIDLPIALSLALGGIGGVVEVFWGKGGIYFDSLATLVFLLLFSRYTLMRTQQHILRHDWAIDYFTPQFVLKKVGARFEQVLLQSLKAGDILKIKAQERIPADGVILKGQSQVDSSVLTGEPFPQKVEPGEFVYCGTRNQGNDLEIEVTACGPETRLGDILQRARLNIETKTRWVRLTDKLARYFVASVLGLAGVLFVSQMAHPADALSRVLALVIVACPCALALATPLIVQTGMKRALAQGFFVRSAEALERLPQIDRVVLDKTGTLTEGRFEILTSEGLDDPEVRAAVLAIEMQSSHPIARALVQHLKQSDFQPAENLEAFQVVPGAGVQANIGEHKWRIYPDAYFESGHYADNAMVKLLIAKEGEVCATVILGDRLRPEALQLMSELKQMNYPIYLLSGDQVPACLHIAQQLGIPAENVFAAQTPEQKEAFFKRYPQALMIGDGINDSMALSKAAVGISVQGSAEENLQNADIYLAEQGLKQLPQVLRHAQIMRNLLRGALGFSLAYNILGISAAMLGWVTPLVAAILMPISALTVYSIALIGGQLLCKS